MDPTVVDLRLLADTERVAVDELAAAAHLAGSAIAEPEAAAQLGRGPAGDPDRNPLRRAGGGLRGFAWRLGGPPLEVPEDLARHTLIHVIGEPENWQMWLQAAGAAAVTSGHGLQFDLHMMSAQAAISGIGVALGLSPMVADALADGRLVAPFKTRIPARDAHFVVTPEDAVDRAEAQAFRTWLIAEARGEGAANPARGKGRGGN